MRIDEMNYYQRITFESKVEYYTDNYNEYKFSNLIYLK